ncbi:MAG TPA: hypothetical protein VFG69_13725, partial [Nannocystaceae bacterium]|nr:hypothetical protein [Nannocystaceae bacterium]
LSAQEGQRALSGLLAGSAANDAPEPVPDDAAEEPATPRMRWSKSDDDDDDDDDVPDDDPAEVDAPGRPAMDEAPASDGETW